jgi:hypothetical protein
MDVAVARVSGFGIGCSPDKKRAGVQPHQKGYQGHIILEFQVGGGIESPWVLVMEKRHMRKILVPLALFAVSSPLALPAWAQTPTLYPPDVVKRAMSLKKTFPDDVIYNLFFRETYKREQFAASLDREGNRSTADGFRDQSRQIMLAQPEQYGALKGIILDCATTLYALDQQRSTIAKALHPQLPLTAKLPELIQIDNQRASALAAARDRMRAVLGPDGFIVTDYWIYMYVAGHIREGIPSGGAVVPKGGK